MPVPLLYVPTRAAPEKGESRRRSIRLSLGSGNFGPDQREVSPKMPHAQQQITYAHSRELYRPRLEARLSQRKIARCIKALTTTVGEYLKRFEEGGLTWPLSDEMTDVELEAELFPSLSPAAKRGAFPLGNPIVRPSAFMMRLDRVVYSRSIQKSGLCR